MRSPRSPSPEVDYANAITLTSAVLVLGWILIRKDRQQEQTDMKIAQLAAALVAIDNRLTKAQTEIVTEIGNLRDALSNVDLPEAAATALANLETRAQTLDDVVPDVVPTPAPEAAQG